MHKFMKMAGCNTEEEFYQKYPSEKAFFAAYPHMKGNQTMKNGGAASGHSGSYWNGERWVSTAGDSGTYANGVYYATGGPVFMPGGSAPIFGMGGSASFNVSNNQYPTPFAMAPGSGRGGGYLQDLPTHMAHGGPIPGAEIVDPFAMYPGTGKGGGMLQDLPVEMKKGGKYPKGSTVKETVYYPSKMNPGFAKTSGDIMEEYITYPGDTLTNEQIPYAAMERYGKSTFFPEIRVGRMSDQGIGYPLYYKPSSKDDIKIQEYINKKMTPVEKIKGLFTDNVDMPAPNTYMDVNAFNPYQYKKGGIHIAPSKRGTFTAAATKHGKSVQAFASQVLANKENYSPAMVKKANFARNASKWQHEYGGSTMMQDGGIMEKMIRSNDDGFYIGPDYSKYVDPKLTRELDSLQGTLPKYQTMEYRVNDPVRDRIRYLKNLKRQQINYGKRQDKIPVALQDGGSTMPDNPGFRALPPAVQQKIMDNMQTGGMVTADRMVYMPGGSYMEDGGMVNPYHPMAKFLRGGYYQDGGSYKIGQYVMGLGYWNGSGFQQTMPDPNWHPPMSTQTNNTTTTNTSNTAATTESESEDESESESEHPGWDKVRNWGNAILGTGMTALGVAGALNERTQARKLRNKQFNDRSTANMYAAMNQPGGKGDYTQQGVFRPDSMTPAAAGKFYPGMAGSYEQGMGIPAKMGGVMNNYTYAHGGYHVGQEVELSDAEIANLKRMGYKFDII